MSDRVKKTIKITVAALLLLAAFLLGRGHRQVQTVTKTEVQTKTVTEYRDREVKVYVDRVVQVASERSRTVVDHGVTEEHRPDGTVVVTHNDKTEIDLEQVRRDERERTLTEERERVRREEASRTAVTTVTAPPPGLPRLLVGLGAGASVPGLLGHGGDRQLVPFLPVPVQASVDARLFGRVYGGVSLTSSGTVFLGVRVAF